jgi:hypothetical protein
MGQSPMGGGVDGLLERSNVNIYVLEIWRMVPIYLMWCIWKEHNAQSFVDCERMMLCALLLLPRWVLLLYISYVFGLCPPFIY